MGSFPLGRAPLVMIALFLLASAFVLARPRPFANQLDFWFFAETHNEEYKERVKVFERSHPGVHVRLQLMQTQVLRDKLAAAFLSETSVPDLVEIEIGDVGRFFQGRPSDIGFADLTDRLHNEGWMHRMIPARFTPWTNRGRIYGVPHDLHPVILLYRDDMFRQCGIDLPEEARTWDEFFALLERPGVLDSRKDGRRDRFGIMLQGTDFGHFRLLLLQRGTDFFDERDNVQFDSPLAIETLRYYQKQFEKDHVAFMQPPNWGPDMFGPMKEDRLFAVLAPDWFVGAIKKNAPEVAGKWRGMKLPAWEPGGRRTSTYGGTMIAIPKQAKDVDRSWELLKFLYFDRDALVNRYDKTRILPPLRDAWTAPLFAAPDPYTGGQPLGKLFVELADSVPPVHQGKYLSEANDMIKAAISAVCLPPYADPAAELHTAAVRIRERQRGDRFRD